MKAKVLKTERGWVAKWQSSVKSQWNTNFDTWTTPLIIEDNEELWDDKEIEIEFEYDEKSLISGARIVKTTSQIIGGYKEFIVIEREALKEFELKANKIMSEGQDDHNVEQIRRARILLETIAWIKDNNIYNKGFEIKN